MRISLNEHGAQVRLGEADGPRRRILLISPGWGSSGYYPADVLERDGPRVMTAGLHMYIDHPGEYEEIDRANVGRSIRDLAAVLETDAQWLPSGPEGPGLYADARVTKGYAPLIDDLAEHIGVSIRGYGEGEPGEAEGRTGRIITALTAVESVDFVTRAGRGGKVLELIESARTAEALTANELRDAVGDATREQYANDDTHVYLLDFSTDDGWVVFERYSTDEESYWRATLTVDGDTITVADDAVEVERQVTYVPTADVTEALREARTRLREARNVAEWFESRIHLDFTVTADRMFGDGMLTRDERIALSGGIGAALDAFRRAIETAAPQLYDRDLDEDPQPQPVPTKESTMGREQELEARVAELETVNRTLEAERDDARNEAARLRDAQALREATDAARDAVAAIDIPDTLTPVAESIRQRALARVQVTRNDQGEIVRDALTEAARAAVDAEVAYLTEATGGKVVGLGEGGQDTTTSPDELREANAQRAASIFN